jgi:V-type H+-transporting ATPase 16kDa proteolipid subunit
MIFGCLGAAYGTAKSGIGIAGVGTFRPDLIMKVWIWFPATTPTPACTGR